MGQAGRADGSDSSAVSNLVHEDKVMNYGCTADTNVHVEYNRATQDGEASGEGSGSNPTGAMPRFVVVQVFKCVPVHQGKAAELGVTWLVKVKPNKQLAMTKEPIVA